LPQQQQEDKGFSKRFRRKTSLLFKSNLSDSEQLLQEKQEKLPTIHPALDKCQVPFLQPIVKQTIHPDPCVDILYKNDSIITTDRRGRIRSWSRPFSVVK
jgi:hypothetical protein